MEEVLNMGLDGVAVEYKNVRRKRGKGHGAEAGLRILDTYTQVENGLGLRLRYLEAFKNHFVCYLEYLGGLYQHIRVGEHEGKNHADILVRVVRLSCSMES